LIIFKKNKNKKKLKPSDAKFRIARADCDHEKKEKLE